MPDNKPCIFGEVLFDMFPDGNRVLGGAPFNVAWHLQAFGVQPVFVSCVGNDESGKKIRDEMQRWGMNQNHLQTDDHHPTGKVQIKFKDDEPQYDIVENCAYDFITPAKISANCGLLYHGSLAIRNPVSAKALGNIKKQQQGKIFIDVNLRTPWWKKETLLHEIHSAHWVKLNEDELYTLQSDSRSLEEDARRFLETYKLDGLVVTLGAKGALAITSNSNPIRVNPETTTNIVDSVGAGDAFASVLILGILKDWSLQSTLERAQIFASKIVGQQGATVQDMNFYQSLIDDWHLKS